MERVKYFLLAFFLGVLVFLVYLAFFKGGNNIGSLDELVKCVNYLECKGKRCPEVPPQCSRLNPEKIEKSQTNDGTGLKTLISNIVKSVYPEDKKIKPKTGVQSIKASELERAIKQKKIRLERKKEEAHDEHQRTRRRFDFRQIDLQYIERGFNYALGNIFFALPLIAFGMSISGLGVRPSLQIYALFSLAVIIAAAFTGEIVIKNYNYLGPYLFILGGAALLLYDEQKSFVLPILGVIIGVFIGFTVASDGPLIDKWPFVVGTIFAAGFILMIFSIAVQLFNKPWFAMGMTIMGGGLIALALMMFAFELDANR